MPIYEEVGALNALAGTVGLGAAGAASALAANVAGALTGNRWVALGDSITLGATDNTTNAPNSDTGEAWPTYVALLGGQRPRLVRNSGVGSNKTADMIARFSTDVAAYAPNMVTIAGGTNDYANAVSFATYQSNIQSLVQSCQSIGARPVLCTIPPRTAGGYQTTIDLWNAWLRRFAEKNRFPLLDLYSVFADSSGNFAAAYDSGDGIHPNAAGCLAAGTYAYPLLQALAPPNAPLIALDNVDGNNMLTNGLFLASTSNMPTGWTPISAPTGLTKLVTTKSGVRGNIFKITGASLSGAYGIKLAAGVTTGFAVGDTLALSCLYSNDGAGLQGVVSLNGGASGTTLLGRPAQTLAEAVVNAFLYQEFVVPAGTTTLNVTVQASVGTGSGNIDYSQVGLYNLTQMGIL